MKEVQAGRVAGLFEKNPFKNDMRIVREQQISNINVVIKVVQAVPNQATYGNMISQ